MNITYWYLYQFPFFVFLQLYSDLKCFRMFLPKHFSECLMVSLVLSLNVLHDFLPLHIQLLNVFLHSKRPTDLNGHLSIRDCMYTDMSP